MRYPTPFLSHTGGYAEIMALPRYSLAKDLQTPKAATPKIKEFVSSTSTEYSKTFEVPN